MAARHESHERCLKKKKKLVGGGDNPVALIAALMAASETDGPISGGISRHINISPFAFAQRTKDVVKYLDTFLPPSPPGIDHVQGVFN